MEHPLLQSLDHLSVEDLSGKISELHKKLGIAARTGNGHLCDQIRMALDSYSSKYQEKLQASYKKDNDALDKLDTKIDIS